MPSFAIIAEGATDQAVIENLLVGFFGDDEPVVNRVQPPAPTAGKPAPGGWTLVLSYLAQGKHREALQLNDFVVVHIDTDVCEEKGYGVSRRTAGGATRTPVEMVTAVRERLVDAMGPDFFAAHGARVLFAVAVDSIECWLLPIVCDGEPLAKRSKTTGCLAAADDKLRRLNRTTLSRGAEKVLASYEAESKGYQKHRVLMDRRGDNPSLDLFVASLEALSPAR